MRYTPRNAPRATGRGAPLAPPIELADGETLAQALDAIADSLSEAARALHTLASRYAVASARARGYEDAPDMPDTPRSSRAISEAQAAMLLRPQDAANRLGIGYVSLYKLLQSGELASIHIGRSRRIPLAALQDYIARETIRQTRD